MLLRRLKLEMYDVRLSLRNLCRTQVLLLNWHPLQDFKTMGVRIYSRFKTHVFFPQNQTMSLLSEFMGKLNKHLNKHNQRPTNHHKHFAILKKCHGKFECLIYEMLLIRKKRPTLNTQNDSIPTKLFFFSILFHSFVYSRLVYSM